MGSFYSNQFAKTPQLPGRAESAAGKTPGDFRHIQISLGVFSQSVGSHKLVRFLPSPQVPQSSQTLALQIEDTDSRSQVGKVLIDRQRRGEFSNVAKGFTLVSDMQAAWAVQVIPLSQVTPLGVEYLNSVVLSIRHVYLPRLIRANTVDQVEFAGVGAWLAPGEEQPSLRRKLMDPGVAVSVSYE